MSDINWKQEGTCNFSTFIGITFPSGDVQKTLLNEVYEEANVDPADVVYVEAHGNNNSHSLIQVLE